MADIAPPGGLSAEAQARWTAVVPLLDEPVDREMLTTYCQVWDRWRKAEDGLARSGQLVKKKGGGVGPNPLIAIANKASEQVRALEARLGLDAPKAAETGEKLLTRRELADKLNKHMMTITKWENEGLPVAVRGARGRPSLYDEAQVVEWVQARDEQARQQPPFMEARARKEIAQAIEAEQRTALRAGKMLMADEVEATWADILAQVRTSLMAVPAKVKARRPGLSREDMAVIEDEITKALELLATSPGRKKAS